MFVHCFYLLISPVRLLYRRHRKRGNAKDVVIENLLLLLLLLLFFFFFFNINTVVGSYHLTLCCIYMEQYKSKRVEFN